MDISSARLLTRSSLPYYIAGGIIVVVFAFVLRAMGRIPWCECGIGLLTPNAWSSSTSQHFADPYSLSHVLHGMFFYFLLFFAARKLPLRQRAMIALLLEIGWEILENSSIIINRYREVTASLDYFGDSVLNSMGDVSFNMLGFWFAYRFPAKLTLAVVIVIELAMLIAIRDNLTLNVLMLLYPIKAIKTWQMGG